MSSALITLHSLLRYAVLITLLMALVRHISGWAGKKEYSEADKKSALFALISCHSQLLLGIILYFTSSTVKLALADMSGAMKNPELRFWAIEHSIMMLLGIILITIGYSTAKRMTDSIPRFKRIAVLYGLGFLIIMASIPWPWATIARGWI